MKNDSLLEILINAWLEDPSAEREAQLRIALERHLMSLYVRKFQPLSRYFDLEWLILFFMAEFRHFKGKLPEQMTWKIFIIHTVVCYLLHVHYGTEAIAAALKIDKDSSKGKSFPSDTEGPSLQALLMSPEDKNRWFFESSTDTRIAELKTVILSGVQRRAEKESKREYASDSKIIIDDLILYYMAQCVSGQSVAKDVKEHLGGLVFAYVDLHGWYFKGCDQGADWKEARTEVIFKELKRERKKYAQEPGKQLHGGYINRIIERKSIGLSERLSKKRKKDQKCLSFEDNMVEMGRAHSLSKRYESRDLYECMRKLLEEVTNDEKELLLFDLWMDGFSAKEVGKKLGLPEGTARQQIHRLKKKIREIFFRECYKTSSFREWLEKKLANKDFLLLKLWANEVKPKEIGKQLGMSTKEVNERKYNLLKDILGWLSGDRFF